MTPQLGMSEWFRIGEQQRVESALAALQALGIRRLRTGISWAEWYSNPQARDWYDWLLPRLAKEVDLLPCCVETPPNQGIAHRRNSPPRNTKMFADFVDELCLNYADCFSAVELWDAPNTFQRWDAALDAGYVKFAETIAGAAFWARKRRKQVVLGGLAAGDPNWLRLMFERGAMQHVDAIGIQAHPQADDPCWTGWEHCLQLIRGVLDENDCSAELWITAGYSTWRHDEHRQLASLAEMLETPVARVYWHSLQDLAPEQRGLSGFHNDEREYHSGLLRADGSKKLLFRVWETEGLAQVGATARLSSTIPQTTERPTLIIGGCSFCGSSLAARLLAQEKPVLVYDDLSDATALENLRWLQKNRSPLLQVQPGDLRDVETLRTALLRAVDVFYFPADGAEDAQSFDVSVRGTVNLLEAARALPTPIPLIVVTAGPPARQLNTEVLEQYVGAYARKHALPACVLRAGLIYGPRQPAAQDALQLQSLLLGQSVMLPGAQQSEEQLLYIDDLLEACTRARQHIAELSGGTFDLNGNAKTTVTLDALATLARKLAPAASVRFRPNAATPARGDTGPAALQKVTGWQPQISVDEGLRQIQRWLLGTVPMRRDYVRKGQRSTALRRIRTAKLFFGEAAS